MKRAWAMAFVLAVLALVAAVPSWADDWDDCRAEDPDLSIAGCTRILDNSKETKKNRASAYYNRGIAWSNKNDQDKAIADYDEALRLNPDHASAYYNRGIAWGDKGDQDKAIADYDATLRLKPDHANAYFNRGYEYRKKGDYDKAIADYTESLRLVPDDASAYLNRGNAFRDKGEYDKAIADYDEALRLRPDYSDAFHNRGYAWDDKGEYDKAIADYSEAIRINPGYAKAYYNRGLSWRKKGDYDRAIADYDETLRLTPEDPAAYTGRGLARLKLGDKSGAKQDFESSLALPAVASNGQWAHDTATTELKNLEDAGVSGTTAGPRIALVVGQSKYEAQSELVNPPNDARGVATTLRKLGFEVTERYDLNRNDLAQEFKTFGDKALGADWALVYFAGHGIEVDGENYLIPIDARLEMSTHVADEALSLSSVMSKVSGASKLGIIILDACRSNPFRSKMKVAGLGRAVRDRGLGQVEPDSGVLVAYAARDGQVAMDGKGEHSPYAAALLEMMETPGMEIDFMFRKVRDRVLRATDRVQEPFTYGSLAAEHFCFNQEGCGD